MKATKRELAFAKRYFQEVRHTTLNPEGPGVVRIHMIPPKTKEGELFASIAIINGMDLIPVNVSWSILLAALIEEINHYHGRELCQEDVDIIIHSACKEVKKVYPLITKKRLKSDMYRILKAFTQVAYGEPVDEEIPYINIGEYASAMKAPHRMDLLVSSMTKNGNWNCNQKCLHCYAAGQHNASDEELDTQDWKRILDKCREVGIPQVTFTGGEPTMREDLIELITHAGWFVTRLNTNGIRLTKDYCRELMNASLDSVQITFYSDQEEIHNSLVGAPKYKETLNGIENALEAGLNLSINTPLCTLNKDYLNTLKFLHEKGVTYVTCSGLITTGNAKKEESMNLQLEKEELEQILKECVEYCFDNGMEISFTSPGWVENDFCQELGLQTPNCGAALSNMAITPGGMVVPCQSWLSGDALGNFLQEDWETIWESEACKKRRDYSASMCGKCPLRVEKEGAR